MSKCLVLPDTHLKIDLVDRIEQLWNADVAEKIVSLGDWLDDWGAVPIEYEKFKTCFKDFVKKHKDHLVLLWGNHDYGYRYNPYQHSGFDTRNWVAHRAWLMSLMRMCPFLVAYRDSDVVFSHAGIAKSIGERYMRELGKNPGTPAIHEWLNDNAGARNLMWQHDSPIWYRPQNNPHKNTFDSTVLQVIGHTPVMEIKYTPEDNILYTDTWSTDSNRRPIGNQKIVVIDTVSQAWEEF